jgi:putative radical SAM-modified peptide
MENEETSVVVLDEGVEETAEEAMACCTASKARIYVY